MIPFPFVEETPAFRLAFLSLSKNLPGYKYRREG